jgi:hypothetical protein
VQGAGCLCVLIAFFVRGFCRCLVLVRSLSLSSTLTLSLQPAACISEYTVGCLPCIQDERPAVVYRHLEALRSAPRNESQLLQPSRLVTLMEVLPCLSPSDDFAPVSRCLPACTRDWDASVQPSPSNYSEPAPHFSSLSLHKGYPGLACRSGDSCTLQWCTTSTSQRLA